MARVTRAASTATVQCGRSLRNWLSGALAPRKQNRVAFANAGLKARSTEASRINQQWNRFRSGLGIASDCNQSSNSRFGTALHFLTLTTQNPLAAGRPRFYGKDCRAGYAAPGAPAFLCLWWLRSDAPPSGDGEGDAAPRRYGQFFDNFDGTRERGENSLGLQARAISSLYWILYGKSLRFNKLQQKVFGRPRKPMI